MISALSGNVIKCSLQTIPSLMDKRVQEKADLIQKIGDLRAKMSKLREQINPIQQDQTYMRQTAVLIQQGQEEIETGQKDIKAFQDQMKKHALHIRQDHQQLKSQAIILHRKSWVLFSQIFNISVDQKDSQVKLGGIKQKRDVIHQHVFRVCQSIPVIHQNLQKARQTIKAIIPVQAIGIPQNHQVMHGKLKTIEEIFDNIRYNLPRFQSKQMKDTSEQASSILENQNHVQATIFYIGSSLLEKMKNVVLWILLESGHQIEQAYQSSKDWVISTPFSNKGLLTTSCTTLIALAILSCNSIPEIRVSLEDLTCEGSFLLFKWKHQFTNY